ncbi:endonuclease/exonuclease/phosphatase family protein [Kitasatospora sp. NPDC056651]|uniref:endonuclease/exonuclease/phosphatase family protein n=1 Tax=Kitasatospora sp. NPDC056651 TaxID=3345892 RepID=UPI0036B51B33
MPEACRRWTAAICSLALLLVLAQLISAAPPAHAAVNGYRFATWNMRGASEGKKWTEDIPGFFEDRSMHRPRNAVLMMQEAGAMPASSPSNPITTHAFNPGYTDYTNPVGVPATVPITVYQYNFGTASRPTHTLYWIRTDTNPTTPGSGRVNMAIMVRLDQLNGNVPQPLVIQPDTMPGGSRPRPLIGVRIGNDSFYSIHGFSGSGNDRHRAVAAVRDRGSVPGGQWVVAGDFNYNLQSPGAPANPNDAFQGMQPGNTVMRTGEFTHHDSDLNENSELDYAVSSDPPTGAVRASRMLNLGSDHWPVEFNSPFAQPPCTGFGVTDNSDPCVPPPTMAARSTGVIFSNRTGCDLTLEWRGLLHGIWTASPPDRISREQGASWGSESSGIATGTEANVRYVTQNCSIRSNDNRQVQLHWDNPFIGSNSYDEAGSDYSTFRIDRAGGVGNNAVVTWTVGQKPLAVVAMGDSYISGEAGRWAGNANSGSGGSAWGTDRASSACNADESNCQHDLQGVYGDTGYDGGSRCDRSDVSEIAGAEIDGVPPELRFNLACSGATTDNVVQSGFKGEKPQVEQLKELAKLYQIKTIVLSVGGNDLDLVGAMTQCGFNFMTGLKSCKAAGADGVIRGKLAGVEDKVVGATDAIHAAMRSQGYDSGNYRLVLQSYPGPIADADDNHYRYPAENYERYQSGGCPFYNEDATWARKEVIPAVSTMLRSAARRGNAFFIDMQDALAGHELCRTGTKQATAANSSANPLPAAQAEWVRWVPYVLMPWGSQGDKQEAIHPNAYGQRALSSCLTQANNQISSGGREFRCSSSPGSSLPSLQTVEYDPMYTYGSVNRATGFLASVQDRSAPSVRTDYVKDPITGDPRPPAGPELKLGVPRSYTGGFFAPGGKFKDGYQSSFTYDNAAAVYAFLQTGEYDRAKKLGDSLLYAQDHDPVNDGRIRASYLPDPFITTLGRDYPVGTPYIGGWSVYTGNMAWAGMAFAHLYKATGDGRYLAGALRAANWIQANSADDRGVGGYTGGYADDSPGENGTGMVKRTWKATEHNIDVGAFFAMLNQLTGDQVWKARSDNAFTFVKSMLSADLNHLWTGTGLDGVSVNEDAVPEDIQTWSYLATLDPAYARTVDWAAGRMAASDGPVNPATGQRMFQGVGFTTLDTTGVWFEGTAHLLAAYQARKAAGDTDKANALINTLQQAQEHAPNADGAGIVAASHDYLDTGQGDRYHASLHTGATAWFIIGAKGGNPFRL